MVLLMAGRECESLRPSRVYHLGQLVHSLSPAYVDLASNANLQYYQKKLKMKNSIPTHVFRTFGGVGQPRSLRK